MRSMVEGAIHQAQRLRPTPTTALRAVPLPVPGKQS
jgi:hypothetical protein